MKESPEIEVKKEVLDNKIELTIYDASRKITGDRWMVILIARARVIVAAASFTDAAPAPAEIETIRKALGGEVVFEQKRERIFVDANDKEAVFGEIYDTFMAAVRPYVSHPDFPGKFIAKQYREFLGRTPV